MLVSGATIGRLAAGLLRVARVWCCPGAGLLRVARVWWCLAAGLLQNQPRIGLKMQQSGAQLGGEPCTAQQSGARGALTRC